MANPYDYRIKLTDTQRSRLELAIDLVEKHLTDEDDTCGYIHYVTVDGDDLGSEYQTCNDSECLEINEKDVKEEYKGKEIEFLSVSNNSDFEQIERCQVCFAPLNGWLTWIREEFNHHEEHTLTKEDIINSSFDVKTTLQSFPSNDVEISHYAIRQSELGNQEPLNEQIKRRDEFVKRVLDYVEIVINELNK